MNDKFAISLIKISKLWLPWQNLYFAVEHCVQIPGQPTYSGL